MSDTTYVTGPTQATHLPTRTQGRLIKYAIVRGTERYLEVFSLVPVRSLLTLSKLSTTSPTIKSQGLQLLERERDRERDREGPLAGLC